MVVFIEDKQMNQQPQTGFSESFGDAVGDGKRVPFPYAFKKLKKSINGLSGEYSSLNDCEPALRSLFRNFLIEIGATPAVLNFDALLKEKSGDKFYRSNGDISWYHELFPLMVIMELATKGKKKGGFDIADLDALYDLQNGDGMVVMLCSHLRHDSVEDVLHDINVFEKELENIFGHTSTINPDYTKKRGDQILKSVSENVGLISQRRIQNKTGKFEKESTLQYNRTMTDPSVSNPGVYMQKQADVSANFQTMHTAPKFTPEKRSARCHGADERYGRTYGLTDKAMEQWPAFKKAIQVLDHVIGVQLYTSKRYISDVDLHGGEPSDLPVHIDIYLSKAMSLNLPEAIHPVHCFMKDLMRSVDPEKDPEKYDRLQNFMAKVIMPSLEPYQEKFPYLFKEGQTARLFVMANAANDNGYSPKSELR